MEQLIQETPKLCATKVTKVDTARNCPKMKKNEAANLSRDHEIAIIG
jgi:hypothetical protein